MRPKPAMTAPSTQNSGFPRIELGWPGKGRLPCRRDDGGWCLTDSEAGKVHYPLAVLGRFTEGEPRPASLVVEGERMQALSAVRRLIAHRVRLAYLDLPRVVVDDKETAFQGETDRTWS